MTIMDILKDWLTTHGFDGLADDDECGCSLEDLAPCGDQWRWCEPAYKVPCESGECDFWMVKQKPERKAENDQIDLKWLTERGLCGDRIPMCCYCGEELPLSTWNFGTLRSETTINVQCPYCGPRLQSVTRRIRYHSKPVEEKGGCDG